jgi:hypothetical protein
MKVRPGALAVWFALLCACAGATPQATTEAQGHTSMVGDTAITFSQGVAKPPPAGTSVDTSHLEIRADGVDRFVSCPPSGELGQGWIPKVADWTPPPASADEPAPPPAPREMEGKLPLTPTEKALEDTRLPFRDCYHRGLLRDPTQDGHVAIVLRIDRGGKVVRVESYGACELQADVVRCMREVAGRLRFTPPAPGEETLVLPVVYAPRAGNPRNTSGSDGYTAAAFLAVETLRPALHACEVSARSTGKRIDAFGTFTMEVDARGRVSTVNVDPYGGEQAILECAAETLQSNLQLPPPAGGRATAIVRLAFNPRGGR